MLSEDIPYYDILTERGRKLNSTFRLERPWSFEFHNENDGSFIFHAQININCKNVS